MVEGLVADTFETDDGKKVYLGDSGGLRRLAERVLASHKETLRFVDLDAIEFAAVEGDRGPFLAKAIRVPAMYRLFVKFSYLILFNATRMEEAPGKQDMVMVHELMHCNTFSGGPLVDHDVEDFAWFLQTYGIDWKSNDKRIIPIEELRELTPWAMPSKKKDAK